MGHYDEAYDEMARESRRITEMRQSQCDHRDRWIPIECNNKGCITKIQCPLCLLIKDV